MSWTLTFIRLNDCTRALPFIVQNTLYLTKKLVFVYNHMSIFGLTEGSLCYSHKN